MLTSIIGILSHLPPQDNIFTRIQVLRNFILKNSIILCNLTPTLYKTTKVLKKGLCCGYYMLLLILATSPWGLFELWGGGFPTSDIDHSIPRLRWLLLRTLIGPSPTAIQCTASPAVFFCPAYAQDHTPTRA